MAKATKNSSNQFPQAQTMPSQPCGPSIVTCADILSSGDIGAITDSRIIESSKTIVEQNIEKNIQDIYLDGKKIGTAREFVLVDGQLIIKEVAVYLQSLIDAAKNDGIKIRITNGGGFRTMQKQNELYNNSKLAGIAAAPGICNHQNGISVDFVLGGDDGKTYEWLVKNAWKYGFIRTVPRERWHWEYYGDWSGQRKPKWAQHSKWGSNGHTPKTMFHFVKRIHACGVEPNGGDAPLKNQFYWTRYGASSQHVDKQTSGKTNTWIGYNNEHLPDKFDRENPGWDRK